MRRGKRVAELLFTTEAFRPQGLPTPNVPMLLDAQMRLIEPACAWLLHVALVRGRTRSKETWRTYGEVLYDWWQTLEANGWAWDRVGSNELTAYRNRMLEGTSNYTGRPYSRATINIRLRVLAMFYRWCEASRLISEVPFSVSELNLSKSRPATFLAHVDATGGRQTVNELTVRHTPSLPRPLDPATIRQVMEGMDARDRLIVEWAVTTGVRRLEIAGLRVSMLPDTASAALPVMPMRLDVTKGGKVRQVYPPLPLIDRTRAYVREERAVAVRRARKRNPSYRETDALFLTEWGEPMTPRRIGAMFTRASKKANVKATLHGIRHTFAAAMLGFLQRQSARLPALNPLLVLQAILGHADLATTGIYLRVLAADLSAVEATVNELYEGLGS
jgi:site-specific recombinase XerD